MKKLLQQAGGNARSASLSETAASNDVLLFALPWPAAKEVIGGLGSLAGKILIDTTNPLAADLSGLTIGTTTSSGEQVAQWAQGAKVVKCFNTVGDVIMQNTAFVACQPVMFYCGDDAGAKKTVHQLAEELGFDSQDAGPLTQSRLLEPFALLWISLAYQQKWGREFAFQAIRR